MIQVVNVEDVLAGRKPNALTLVLPHALDPVREPYRVMLLHAATAAVTCGSNAWKAETFPGSTRLGYSVAHFCRSVEH